MYTTDTLETHLKQRKKKKCLKLSQNPDVKAKLQLLCNVNKPEFMHREPRLQDFLGDKFLTTKNS